MGVAWTRLAGLPPYGEYIEFHLPGDRPFREGVVVEFQWEDITWVGNFAPGWSTHSSVHIMGATAYVIAEGNGYRVKMAEPREYDILRPSVITDARFIEDRGLLVLAGLVDVTAYSEDGRLWTTKELSMDGLRLQVCSATIITGVADRVVDGGSRYFNIDPETGNATLGAQYP